MGAVRRILQAKGNQVWTTSPGAKLSEALAVMAWHNVGALPVMENDRVVGIFSERDFVRKMSLEGKTSLNTPVKTFMSEPVFFIKPDQSIEECMALMTEKHIRHLPVLEGEELVGIISIGDVVKEIITEKEFTIQHLENYITGKK